MNLLLNYAPAGLFLGAYFYGDIYLATQVLIASLITVVLVYRLWKGEWHKMHLATAIIASVLGGLTLYLHDPTFIKYKPSAVYGLFSLALIGSHFIGDKVLLQRIPQQMITLPEPLWRKVNLAWAIFFAFCAGLNVYVAAHFDEATWVKFKAFGFTGMSIVFMLGHLPFIHRHLPQE